MFGGPTGVDASTGAPFAVYDAVEDKTTTPSDGFDYLHIAFAVTVEDKSFVPIGNLVGAFIMTHAYHHRRGNDQSLQPYAVRRVTIRTRRGPIPAVAVTGDLPSRRRRRHARAIRLRGVWYDDKILVHGGFHVDGAHALVATSCVENPTDAVWAFDMNTFSGQNSRGRRDRTATAPSAPAIPEPVGEGTRRRAERRPRAQHRRRDRSPGSDAANLGRIHQDLGREFPRTPATLRTSHPISGASTSSPKRGRSSRTPSTPARARGTRQPRAPTTASSCSENRRW